MIIGGIIVGIITLTCYFFMISPDKSRNKKEGILTSTIQQKPHAKQTISATFTLPANGTTVGHDEKGEKPPYKKGQYVRFDQLTPIGEYLCVNDGTPSWSTRKKFCVSGPATADGFIALASLSGRDMRIRVTVFNK